MTEQYTYVKPAYKTHGEIKDLGLDIELYVLALRDPDNIQLELTAPYV